MHIWEATYDGLSIWVPATHMQDLDWLLGSGFELAVDKHLQSR